MNNPLITRAEAEDNESVLELMEQFAGALNLTWDRALREANLRHLSDHPSVGGVWLIRDEGKAAGYLALTTMFSFEFGGVCVLLDELFVATAHQGRGLAASALVELDKIADSMGARQVFLEAAEATPKLPEMYARQGFSRRPYYNYHRPVGTAAES